jgi:cellulose synthase/poly-beta-1,6-N-acetylglucosamine synthase-like glycosyltransferase
LFGQKIAVANYQPTISIVIAAYNEEEHIRATIENKLSIDYPREKIEIIVVSDGSDDNTDSIVAEYSTRGVKLIRQEPRMGKTAALNLAMGIVKSELTVFSDANSIYSQDAVSFLAINFSDPKVGYATGKMVYINSDGSLIGDGCNAYMKYENMIREGESKIGSLVGVDGGVDAIRSCLYVKMNNDQLPDFVLPLSVVERGYRVIYEPRAVLREMALSDGASEYRMRVRVALRAMWALYDKRAMLNPFFLPLYSFQLISHKLLRYLAFFPLLVLFFSSIVAASDGSHYQFMVFGQIVFYGVAIWGLFNDAPKRSVFVSIPVYFLLLNIACAHAFLKFVLGKKQVVWAPRGG